MENTSAPKFSAAEAKKIVEEYNNDQAIKEKAALNAVLSSTLNKIKIMASAGKSALNCEMNIFDSRGLSAVGKQLKLELESLGYEVHVYKLLCRIEIYWR